MASKKQKKSDNNFLILISAIVIITALILAFGLNQQTRIQQKQALKQVNMINQHNNSDIDIETEEIEEIIDEITR